VFVAGFTRRLQPHHRDRGAVAVLVAVLLGSGVLIGMAALAVDVGNLYAERAQLLSGADAAALRVAQVCADPTTAADCAENPATELAENYANENANDGATEVAILCGRVADFRGCSEGSPPEALTECIGPPPAEPIPYVEVHTSTLQSDGKTFLPPVFAQAVLGGGFKPTVQACARAAWGPPSRANGLALTISACDWNGAKAANFPIGEQAFPVYDEAKPRCGIPGAPGPGPGLDGFRWFTDAGDGCRMTALVTGKYPVHTGDSKPTQWCGEQELTALRGRPVLVPVFSDIVRGGGSAEYTVSGFAAFVLTGWNLPGTENRPPCPTGVTTRCIYGYFTAAVVSGSGAVGGPDLGARIVARVG
jgi:hypothetical protein